MNIFSIKTLEQFNNCALETFRFQAKNCAPYRQYISLLGIDPNKITSVSQIPFMPIELFKSQEIIADGMEPQQIFTSSGTGGVQSRHLVADISLYEESFMKGFEWFYHSPTLFNIFALLPSYLEREGSSLIYMIDHLLGVANDGGFFLYDYDNLVERLESRDKSKKTLLFGVTFALLDLVERYNLKLGDDVVVMETGGMKGRRRELPRDELHAILTKGLGVNEIHSEYGMCECLSQSYSNGDGVFFSPPWMKIVIRSLGDPTLLLPQGRRGGINIIDLANKNSISFLQTQDIGLELGNNSFKVEGRIDHSDIRGCNLLV